MSDVWQYQLLSIKKPVLLYGLIMHDEDQSPNVTSYVGGKPYLPKSEKIPVCGGCGDALSFVFQLREPTGLVVFYYCFACMPHRNVKGWEVRTYPDPKPEEMRKKLKLPNMFPYCGFEFEPAWSLPDWEGLKILAPTIAESIANDCETEPWDFYQRFRDEALGPESSAYLAFCGGYPQFLKEAEIPLCPCCKKPMKLWVQMDTCEEINLIWGNTGCMYI